MKIKKLHPAWIVLFGVCLFMGLARGGINNTGGLFMVPVMADTGCGAGEFMLYYSVSSLVTFLFLPAAGRLMRKYDIRLLLAAGLAMQAGSFAAFGLMKSIWGWYILAVPLSVGSVFTTQIGGPVLIGNWFRKYSGLAVGMMMAASSLIGAVFQPFAGALITRLGWRCAYLLTGAVVGAVGIPVILLAVRGDPGKVGMRPLGEDDSAGVPGGKDAAPRGVAAQTAKKSAAFWFLAAFVFFVTAAASFSQHIPSYAAQLGYDTGFAGTAMSFFMLGSLCGSLLFGFLSDRIGAQLTTVLALACGIAAVLAAIFGGGRPLLFNISTAVFGFSSAAVGTMTPLLTAAIFGQKEYGEIYAAIAMGMAFAGIAAMPGYGFIYDAAGSYIPVLWMIAGMFLLCEFCIAAAFMGKKRLLRRGLWES